MGLALTAVAYVVALLQSPGRSSSDTKINLHIDPLTYLSQVASVWSPTEGLGHVQGGQYAGYLWPMGPFFALGQELGLSGWLTERLWLGTLLAISAYGVVRLMDALLERRRGPAHLIAGLFYMFNPYVVVLSSRTSVFLLAYAALPWLLLVTRRGLRDRRRWRWAAAFALITTSTGAGVNATVTVFVVLGPILLALYEFALGDVEGRDVWSFVWRAFVASAAASIWWVVPLAVQTKYGVNFLQYTEQIAAIWASTSVTESLRLMGYWPTYLGVGFTGQLTPYFGNGETMLFNPFVVAATLLVPALALSGFALTRRWRHGPYFLGTALIAVLLMSVSWPSGTPGRRAADFLFDHLTAIDFLRTTYKAGPLLALAVAMLAGAAVRMVWPRLRGRPAHGAMLAAAGALIVLGALPFVQGRAIELTWKSVPSWWRAAAAELNRSLPANSRAIVLPGQAYAYYTWGGTVDPILTALTSKPIAIRNVPPFDDLRAADLLWSTDDLVQQQRLLPGQLPPLLDLMSARQVITATDDDDALSGALAPAPAAHELATQPGFARPTHAYGPLTVFPAPRGSAQRASVLPRVRIYDTPARGLVRVEPVGPATVVDGSAEGLADISALHQLPGTTPLFYAADESDATIRAQAAAGAEVFITDSNRRRVFVASRILQNYGWTVPASEGFSADAALLDPFPARGTDAQTVAVYTGARDVLAPYDPELAQFPEHQPYAAFDGDPSTSWLADTTLDEGRQYVQANLDHAIDIPYLDLLPDASNPFVHLTEVAVNGTTFAVHDGWNRLPVALHDVSVLRIAIAHVHDTGPATATGPGIAEVRIPGVTIRQYLRPPVIAQDALRGAQLSHATLNYVFERTTAANPLRRGPAPELSVALGNRLQAEPELISEAQDPETGIARIFDPPAVRRWRIIGLASVSPTAPDPALDTLAGTDTHGATFTSSGRLQGLPGYRASRAFDGSRATAWVAPIGPYQPAWIGWRTPMPTTLRSLVLVRSTLPVRFPSAVVISVDGGPRTPALAVGPGGTIRLPAPLRGRSFRLSVLRASGSPRDAVAIAEIRGTDLETVTDRSAVAPLAGRCGDLVAQLNAARVALRVSGTVGDLDAGDPLNLSACGIPVLLPTREVRMTIAPAAVRPLIIELRSPAPDPLATAAIGGGAVLSSGTQSAGSYTGVRVRVDGPSWLVLGESYNAGWQATCDGRSLGPPTVIDAFANGWRIGTACRNVSITYAPQRLVNLGFLIGGLACLALIAVLLLGLRGRTAQPAALPWNDPATRLSESVLLGLPPAAGPWRPRPALIAGVAAAAAFGFLFGLRAGVVIGPAYALLLWRGVPTRRLIEASAVLLIAIVPLLYVIFPGTDQGGYDTGYPSQHLAAHWVAVAALALLALALLRTVPALRRSAGDRHPVT